jgi:ATP-binding cassette subfamily F protein 3
VLTVSRVSKRYADRLVLNEVTFTIGDTEKVALIGPNGSGKTTLVRIVAGHETADSGAVGGSFAGTGARYLAQGRLDRVGLTAAASTPELGAIWRLGRTLGDAQTSGAEETLSALAELEQLGGWPAFADAEATLRGLGIDYLEPDEPYEHLSGGERTKLGLADLLFRPGPFLLLDEPTNHLDIKSLDWIEGFLSAFAGAVLLVSHDRALIDAVAGAVLELDPLTHTIRRFVGGYSQYQAQVEQERRGHAEAYQRQQEQIQQIEADIRRIKQRATRFDTLSANDHWRRIGKKVARTAKVRERKLERVLESEKRLERPKRAWQLKADFSKAERAGDLVVQARDVSLALGSRRIFEDISLLVRNGERVVLTGPNGSGKTSLLRLVLGQIAPEHGLVRLGAGVQPGYLSQQQEGIDLERTPLEQIRAAAAIDETAARTYLHRFLFSGEDVGIRNASLSYGQRSRLALARLILSGVNLLVLDEPLNHLDLPSRERFEEALTNFQGTVLAVSHDRYFIRRFAERLLVLSDGTLWEGDAEDL